MQEIVSDVDNLFKTSSPKQGKLILSAPENCLKKVINNVC